MAKTTAKHSTEPPASDDGLRAYRDSVLELSNDQLRTYDKALLSLSSGAFGLSILFVDKIAGDHIDGAVHDGRFFLVTAWTCFLAAVLCTLASFQTSSEAGHKAAQEADRCLATGDVFKLSHRRLYGLTYFLNIASLLLFMIGASALAVFALANV